VASLRVNLENGRFPHAFLCTGPEGVGKRTFARKLAQALLCEQRAPEALDPCGKCPGCLQVEAGTHPDMMLVERPEDKHELPISLIRELCLNLGLKPARGKRKIVILDDADDLNEEASNAFLKTLEEPPPGSVLILIGTSPELQLDTIVSRCRIVRFDPLPEADLAALLLEQEVTADPAEAARLARLGEGSVSRARGLADPGLTAFRRACIDELANSSGFSPPALARRLEEFINEAGKESVVRRTRASLLMGELARLFRGVLWQTAGLDPPSPDPDDRIAIAGLAERLDPEDALVLTDRCLEADYHIQRKAYVPLIVAALAHDLGRLVNPRA